MMISLALLPLVGFTYAHATWQQIQINGKDQNCVRTVSSNSPITDVNSPDLTCNKASPAKGSCSAKVSTASNFNAARD